MSEIVLCAVGDVWFGDHPVCLGHGVNSNARKKGPNFFFQHIKDELKGDINFCNLESVLSDIGLNKKSLASCEMRGFPECSVALRDTGFNLVNIANNHMMQHGSEAFLDTLNQLDSQNIAYVGSDCNSGDRRTNIFRYKKGNLEIGVVGFSIHKDTYAKERILYSYRASFQSVLEEIQIIKQEFDGILICSLHWGDEYINQPSKQQVDFAHTLIDSGVSVILGHHPHVLQGIEKYNGGIIAYSLGNFLFDLWPKETKKTIILKLYINENKINYIVFPVLITDKYQPVPAKGALRENIVQFFLEGQKWTRDSANDVSMENYRNAAITAENDFRRSSYMYFIRNINKYSLNIIYQTVKRTFIRKIKALYSR